MVEQLFGSKTRVKLLKLFYANPNRSFYVREITRKIDEQINSVRRELSNLLSIGIISSETQNNKLFYEVDKNYEYYKPLSQIFNSDGAIGDDGDPEDTLKLLGRVDIAVFTGQFTKDKSVDVDLLVVGDINKTQLDKYVQDLEKKEGKELRYAVLSSKDLEYRGKVNDKFLKNVRAAKKQILIDRNNFFEEQEEK